MTDLIDFGIGQPALSLLPVSALRTAAGHYLALGDANLLQYGKDQGDAAGSPESARVQALSGVVRGLAK